MRSSTIAGLAVGAIIGAVVIDMYQPAQDVLDDTKAKVKKAVNSATKPTKQI